MRDMFDAIAPRYDLVNRIMTFRLDVRWRRRAVRRARPAAGSRVLDLASGTGDLCVELAARRATARSSVDLSLGMLRGRPQRRAAGAGRHPAPARARRVGRRRDVRVRPAQPRRPRRRSSPSWPASCAPAGASPCSTSASRATGSCAGGHGIYFGKVVPRIGGLLSDAAAYRYLPAQRRLPAAARRRWWPCCARAGFADAAHARAQRRHHPAAHRHPRPLMRAVTALADDATAALDLNDVARGDGFLFVRDGVGLAGRGVAARVPLDEAPALLASIEHDDRDRRLGVAPGRHRLGAVRARRAAASWSCPRVDACVKTADGRPLGDRSIDDADRARCRRRRAEPVGRRRYTIEPVTPVDHVPRRRRRGPRRRARRRARPRR